MTATTTTATTQTATAVAAGYLPAIAENFGHGAELPVHLQAAVVGGYELPEEALELVAKALHLAKLHEGHVKPPEHRTVDTARLLAGASTAQIFEADAVNAEALLRWEKAGELLIAARGKLAGMELDLFRGPLRDELIAGPLRSAMAALLKEAKIAAGKLEKFAPDYPPALLEQASDKDLAIWRQSRILQSDFDVLVRAWLTSWTRATRSGTGSVELHFSTEKAGGYFAWVSPDDVADPDVRYGRDTEVLRVATAGSTYRLISPAEFKPMIADLQATLPADGHVQAWQLVRQNMCGVAR
jgi:hypothetical protein